ncbi:hypothetical protein TEU_04380 [Thermococcus eurythermalis]|uniref:HEAT repeat domain-containing protein n=1 Tax=Thermococcus eurythermalis TaxID=1505907 RepID=A0A097QT30_9EURY|nr:hypothetical protein [Thermococcus eurythermalis]AIU69635.1 hypothetical protein TEU_04380 [Thermococcus eurythermalis]
MSKSRIDSVLKKWEIMNLIKLAKDRDDALREILRAATSDDPNLRLASLSALLDVVRGANWRERKRILELGFDVLVDALSTDDPGVIWRTLEILATLLKNNPLSGARLLKLVRALMPLSETENVLIWDGILKVVDNVMAPYIDNETAEELRNILQRGTRREAIIVAEILLETGAIDKNHWTVIVENVAEALLSGEPVLVDAGLVASVKISKLPPVYPMDILIKELFPALRKLIADCNDQIRKARTIEAFDRLRETLVRYYRVRPREAQRAAEELMSLGLVDEALLISSAAGTTLASSWATYRGRGRL